MDIACQVAIRYATLKNMEALSALNWFGKTSVGIVKTCSVPCADAEKYRFKTTWTLDCCKIIMHLGCANRYMMEIGMSTCPSCCWVPFHGKKPSFPKKKMAKPLAWAGLFIKLGFSPLFVKVEIYINSHVTKSRAMHVGFLHPTACP